MKPGTGTLQEIRKEVAVGILILILATSTLSGCASDVVMLNPRTGETATCSASPLNPWSQQETCVGQHIAQGWKRLEP